MNGARARDTASIVRYRTESHDPFFIGTNVSTLHFCGRSRRSATDAAFHMSGCPGKTPGVFFWEAVAAMRRVREKMDKATREKSFEEPTESQKKSLRL
jgi:hypothetical protein